MGDSLRISTNEPPTEAQATRLYDAVGWSMYTRDMPTLMRAIKGSSYLRCAHDGPRLVGLIRCVSDDATIAYLQDVLVDPAYQRRGIGRTLCIAAMDRFSHCRQFVLITDDRAEQTAFYESLSLVRFDKANTVRLHAFARMPGLE